MAKIGRKRTEDEETAIDNTNEEEILLPGEESDGADVPENEETHEMTETAQDVVNEEATVESEAANLLTDAQKELSERTNGKAVEMLDIDSLPKDAKILKMQLAILGELADEYKVLFEELREGTSDKDEKVQNYIANIHESDDEDGKIFHDALVEAKEARIAAIKAEEEAEKALAAHVENVLAAKGGSIMSEEDIAAKTAEIKAKYSEYVQQHKAAKDYLDNYRSHKNPEAGEIGQYVTHIDRPSGRATKVGDGAARSGGSGAGRSVHVSNSRWSTDGGVTWTRAETTVNGANGPITLSNPATLATQLGKAVGGTVSKDDIVDAWYSAAGQTRETASKANMPDVKTFDFEVKTSDGPKTVQIELTKRQ